MWQNAKADKLKVNVIKKMAIILLLVFVGIQFIPRTLNQDGIVPISDFMVSYEVPEQIEDKIIISCYDCHSNNTTYPWYNKVQPVAWLLENHVNKGKADLNFSEWNNYSNRRKKGKIKSIISQIESNEMPMYSYTLIHSDAKFSKKEKKEVIEWITKLKDSL